MFGFESTTGSATGTGLSNYGWKGRSFADIDEAVEAYKTEYLPKVAHLPMGLRERIGDYIYHTGRSPEDLMLYAAGVISLDEINSPKVHSAEWAKNKSYLEGLYDNPEFWKSIDMAKHNVYRTTRDKAKGLSYTLENPNPAYPLSWSKRAELWGDPLAAATPAAPMISRPASPYSPITATPAGGVTIDPPAVDDYTLSGYQYGYPHPSFIDYGSPELNTRTDPSMAPTPTVITDPSAVTVNPLVSGVPPLSPVPLEPFEVPGLPETAPAYIPPGEGGGLSPYERMIKYGRRAGEFGKKNWPLLGDIAQVAAPWMVAAQHYKNLRDYPFEKNIPYLVHELIKAAKISVQPFLKASSRAMNAAFNQIDSSTSANTGANLALKMKAYANKLEADGKALGQINMLNVANDLKAQVADYKRKYANTTTLMKSQELDKQDLAAEMEAKIEARKAMATATETTGHAFNAKLKRDMEYKLLNLLVTDYGFDGGTVYDLYNKMYTPDEIVEFLGKPEDLAKWESDRERLGL
jgi:hypothetical protein